MLNDIPMTRDLVLVGGGHAHALVLNAWGMNPLPGARVTVINPGPTAPYTGMLPGHVAGHYERGDLEIDLVRLCHYAGARLILSKATGIDRTLREIAVEGRGTVGYDVASIDIGITAMMDLPGFADHAVGAKPLDVFAARWRTFLDQVTRGDVQPEVAVIGGGVAGCELAMAMAYAMTQAGVVPKVTVIEAGAQISGVGPRARAKLFSAMTALGIALRVEAQIERVAADQVLLSGQGPIPAQFCVGAAGAFAHDWIAGTDLPQRDGFITIDPDLRVAGDDALFAVGDCAHMPFAPRPKAGVFAVRAAPILHDNLRAALSGGKMRNFKPQKNYLKLISLGGKSAMAEKFGVAVAGTLLWRWKDRIDQAFMDKLSDLPRMKAPTIPAEVATGVRDILADKPLCGGCGAKVGGGVLSNALSHLPENEGDVIAGAGDDAAILRMPGGGFQVMSTDHLRSITQDPVQMTRIAAVHALGDIWAMGARPQAALASLILPRMSAGLQTRTLREITDTATDVFQSAGAQLVGGHTTMGAEMTIGFTVTGTRRTMPITVAGARPGDRLILTRPIGSGVLMAAHMQGLATGRDVANTLRIMERGQHLEADILSAAHALTDVTGFGLAGHVRAICVGPNLDAELWQNVIPVYTGARALSEAGVASTLMPANQLDAPVGGIADALLFDPQTAGGLLAALPPDAANRAVEALRTAGREGHIIGRLSPGSGTIRLI